LGLVKGLNGVEYFLPFSFFDQTQTTTISIATKPSITVAISHIPSSSPFPSSSSHPQMEPSRRTTAVVATTTHCSATSQLNRIVVAIGAIDIA
jgi:hypothetical protein